jgi:hypothetical protein
VRLWIASAFAQARLVGRGRRFASGSDGGEIIKTNSNEGKTHERK